MMAAACLLYGINRELFVLREAINYDAGIRLVNILVNQ